MQCARYGTSYSAVIVFAAPARVAAGSPTFFATKPGVFDIAEYCARISTVDRPAPGPSSQVISSFSRPSFAGQNPFAITATPEGTCTTFTTPGIALALSALKLATFPPNTGARATTAVSILGM